jgi:hypothetical protein
MADHWADHRADHRAGPKVGRTVDLRMGLMAVARRGQLVGLKVDHRAFFSEGRASEGRASEAYAREGQREPWLRKSVGRL